ncbi:hypothetical protein [Streptomyces sp. NBC_01361]|uniref:hypothetical protein n=1 Tax=Streptomyces sp. NBC_01361 TaxID=2903838 RepID=UPI002E335B93|nr:hypothetical protein [Streptomyces sp. NBC_01361]
MRRRNRWYGRRCEAVAGALAGRARRGAIRTYQPHRVRVVYVLTARGALVLVAYVEA